MPPERVDLFAAARAQLVACFELRDDDFAARDGLRPAWTLVLLPSFGHDLFLRASREAGGPEVRLVTLQASLGASLGFTLEHHLYATIRGIARPPHGALHDVRERCDEARWSRFAAEVGALDVPALDDVPLTGLDGTYGFATADEAPGRRGAFRAWSPREGSPQRRFWDAMLGLARQTLLDERSQRTLDLAGGDAASLIEGETPIVRVGRAVFERDVPRLQALFDGLGGRRALVDLLPLAGDGPFAGRAMASVRWPAEVLWVVPPGLAEFAGRHFDAGRCVGSLEEAVAWLRGAARVDG
ncbi:MAG: hypothetical protein U0324_36005 [Polyangiales bacterium]